MKYPIKKILILVTILAVPGFLYYLLQEKGKNRYKPLAIYGPKSLAGTFHSVRGKQIPDTVYHILSDFKLLNQQGQEVSWKNYKDKITLFHLFYTNNENPGLVAAENAVKELAKAFDKNPMVHFIGLTIDPAHDTPGILSAYARQSMGQLHHNDLLTGDTVTIYKLIRKGLLVDALTTVENGKRKFIFSNMLILVDSQHRIRGYYESTSQEALSKLDDEIKVLIAEELRNTKDGR